MAAISLPIFGWVKGAPKLVRSISRSRVGDRSISFVEFADPFWMVEVQTSLLDFDERIALDLFAARAEGGHQTVIYTPPAYFGIPQAYWSDPSASALANTGAVTGITDGFTVAFNSIDNGLVLTAGDLIGLEKDDYRSMHMVVTGGTASGNALSITVEPFVPGYITTGAVVRFKEPQLNCRMVPGSYSIPDDIKPAASFTLVEVPK